MNVSVLERRFSSWDVFECKVVTGHLGTSAGSLSSDWQPRQLQLCQMTPFKWTRLFSVVGSARMTPLSSPRLLIWLA